MPAPCCRGASKRGKQTEEAPMTLILHAGAREVTFAELSAVPTPKPTATHLPVPHHQLVELARYALGFYKHEIVDEHHAVMPDGARYFGVMTLRSTPWGLFGRRWPAKQPQQIFPDRHRFRLARLRL